MRKLRYCFGILAFGTMLFAACGSNQEKPLPTETPQVSEAPEENVTPTSTTKPTPTPMGTNLPEGVTLLNTYGETFGRIGTCITAHQLVDPTTIELLKANYNSITMENEMKPQSILKGSNSLLSLEGAKELNYVIPDNYPESVVPELKFNSTDSALKFCAENNLGLRGHTLVWHSQTPSWFFRVDYKPDGEFVTPEIMDARMEFYIRSVMGHVYDSEYGYVLYSWDVVNEYLHAENSGWEAVYGKEGLTPSFVKKAYKIADDVLRQYGIREEVSLLYNDYSTYSITLQVLRLLQFINEEEKLCDGVGMQSHLSAQSPPAIKYKLAVEDFLEEGYEVQITELDVGNKSDVLQANYLYEVMGDLLELKQAGGKITGITYWGLSDMYSWRKSEKPLLFSTLKTPKLSYYKVLEAYIDAGLYGKE